MIANNLENISEINKSEFIISQIEQALETFRAQNSLMLQIIIVLILANIYIIGYAINSRIAGFFIIGALFPIIILVIVYRITKFMLPTIYTAIFLEIKYGGNDSDWLASTFISTLISVDYFQSLKNICTIQDSIKRINALNKLKSPKYFEGNGILRISFILSTLGQIMIALILYQQFNWRLL